MLKQQKRKQLSIDFIDYTKTCINDLLSSNIPQSTKYKLCVMMEKLMRDLKQNADYRYLYWQKYGKLDWDAEKHIHLAKMNIGVTINIPKEYVIGPDASNDSDFVSDIQGEYSRVYIYK